MLKPIDFNVTLIFECPECQGRHWYAPEELIKGGTLFCCGESHEINPIKSVNISCDMGDTIPEEAWKVLQEYGYTKEQILMSNVESNDPTEYVKQFLASQQ